MTVGSLSGGLILTMDPARPAYPEATVVIEEGRVAGIVDGYVRHKESIDCRGSVVIPGFVNTHAHMAEVLWRGCGGEQNTIDWISNRKHPLMAQLDGDSIAVGVRLACAEMLRSGTTAVLDPEVPANLAAEVASTAADTGIRAALAVAVASGAGYGAAGHSHGHHHHAHGAADSVDPSGPEFSGFARRWRRDNDERIELWLGLRVLSAADRHLGQVLSSAMERHRLRLTFHCAEQEADVEAVRAGSGLGALEYAESIGLLGPNTVISHGVHLEASDLEVLRRTATAVSHCPSSNSRTGAGVAPVPAMISRGVNVGLGTDGGMVNDRYDMLSELRYAALLHKAINTDPKAITPERALTMATRAGAKALGLESGIVRKGAPADLSVVDLAGLGSWPAPNPVDTLVFSAGRSTIRHVLVAGEPVVCDGDPVAMNVPELLLEAAEVSRETIRSAGLEDEVKACWQRTGRDSPTGHPRVHSHG